jgi:hypothetical protein
MVACAAASAIPRLDKINSVRRRLLEGYADIRKGLPSDAAFPQCMAGIEGKLEFDGKVRGTLKMQAGAVIAQIADDTANRRASGQNELGALEYFGPRKSPTLRHGQAPNLQFGENDFSPNPFHNRKRDCWQSPNLWKLCRL